VIHKHIAHIASCSGCAQLYRKLMKLNSK